MATTTNFGWETPDDTDLVKDGALAIRTLGSAIDTSFVDLKGGTTGQNLRKATNTDLDFTWAGDATNTVIDAEGDLLVGDSADTLQRLAIGTTGQVLTVDTAVDGKIKWAAAAGGGSNWTLLNTGGTALTGAQTVTVSSISGKSKILVLIENASSASAGAQISVRINTDTGNNYYVYGFYQIIKNTYDSGSMGNMYENRSNALIGNMGNNAAAQVSGYVLIDGCNASGVKTLQGTGSGNKGGGVDPLFFTYGGYYNSASTVSSVSAFSDPGNFDGGTMYVYATA